MIFSLTTPRYRVPRGELTGPGRTVRLDIDEREPGRLASHPKPGRACQDPLKPGGRLAPLAAPIPRRADRPAGAAAGGGHRGRRAPPASVCPPGAARGEERGADPDGAALPRPLEWLTDGVLAGPGG